MLHCKGLHRMHRNGAARVGRAGSLGYGLAGLLILTGLFGCASKTQVFTTDLTRQAGLYVVGYTTNQALRRAFEDRLVADLIDRGMLAYPSHVDLPSLAGTTADDVVRAANARGVVGVVLVNQATAETSGSPVRNPDRVTPLHPDIQTFYRASREEMVDPTATSEPAFAEVNVFLIDGPASRLLWSGTTWAFHQPGDGSAVGRVSETIAEQIRMAREDFRPSGRPGA